MSEERVRMAQEKIDAEIKRWQDGKRGRREGGQGQGQTANRVILRDRIACLAFHKRPNVDIQTRRPSQMER